jgi:hypothetical protein
MGDRVNIVVANVASLEGIAIYSHWGGNRMPETVGKFLNKVERYDIDYFTRNLLMNVVADGLRGDGEHAGINGFDLVPFGKEEDLRQLLEVFQNQLSYGVSLWLAGDREYPVIILDPEQQKVWIEQDYEVVTIKEALARCREYNSRSFEEFKEVKTWSKVKEIFNAEKALYKWS